MRCVLGKPLSRILLSGLSCILIHNRKELIMPKPRPVVKEGKVVSANRKFYVTIGRTRREIPTGPLVDAAALRKLVGRTVPVTLFGKSVVAIGRPIDIICYVPADPFL